jgi:hypothetical protein
MNAPTATLVSRPTTMVAAPIGFLGAYLASGPVSDSLADRPLPLPDTPAAEAAAYFAANPLAVTASAALQAVSVLCLAVFVAGLAPLLRGAARDGSRLAVVGYLAVAAMVVSSVLAVTAAVIATPASADTVYVLRQSSFYTGGVAHVVALGAFVLGASLVLGRRRLIGRPSRWFGYVAGALAVLSVLSLGIYYATALLPVGRVLCMVWAVAVGIRLARVRPTHDPADVTTGR